MVAVKTEAARGLIVFIDKRTGRVLREYSKRNVREFGSLSIFNYNGWRTDNINSDSACKCEHLCIPRSGSLQCLCKDGFETDPEDSTKCIPNRFNSTSYLLVTDDYQNAIYKVAIDLKSFTPIHTIKPVFTRPIGLAYDARGKRIFYYDFSYRYIRVVEENGTVTSFSRGCKTKALMDSVL